MDHWLDIVKRCLRTRVSSADWDVAEQFRKDLETLLSGAYRDDNGVLTDVLGIKSKLADLGYGALDVSAETSGRGASASLQAVVQFIAGYHDLDLRDAAHVGHGRLILRHGHPDVVAEWAPRLAAGELVGIAATEEFGGTNVRSIATSGHQCADGSWLVSGRKTYISRIREASAFVVFLRRDDDRGLAAVVVPADAPGVRRTVLEQDGLRGWSWGRLALDGVRLPRRNMLTDTGEGRQDTFNGHFDYYRPMVGITALGAAAAVFDTTLTTLRDRTGAWFKRPLDSSLERIGQQFARLQSAILGSLAAVESVELGGPYASIESRTAKAHGVQTAYECAEELLKLSGASSFERGKPLSKTLHDLRGYLFADGIHDALLQSAGQRLLRAA